MKKSLKYTCIYDYFLLIYYQNFSSHYLYSKSATDFFTSKFN